MLFEKATRLKLKFSTVRGLISVEDLWDMPTSGSTTGFDLFTLGNQLYTENSKAAGLPFTTEKKVDPLPGLRFEIVTHIINVKMAEKAKTQDAANRRIKRQELLAALAEKEKGALSKASAATLRKQIDEIDAEEETQ